MAGEVTQGVVNVMNNLRELAENDQSPANILNVLDGTQLLASKVTWNALANENGWEELPTGPLGKYLTGIGAAYQVLAGGSISHYSFIMRHHANWLSQQ